MPNNEKSIVNNTENTGLFLLFFAFLYFCFFGSESLWVDELYSWYFANNDLSYWDVLSQRMTTDVHPPIYYSMLYFWGKLFGQSKEALRLLSLVPIILSFAFLHFTKFERFDLKFKHLLICLIASSFLVFKHSMDARSYEWIFLFSLVSSLYFLEIVSDILDNRKISGIRKTIFFSVVYCLSLLHFISFIYAGTLILITFVVSLKKSEKSVATATFALGILSLVSMSLWIFLASDALGENLGGGHWIKMSMAPIQIISFLAKLFSVNLLLAVTLFVAFKKNFSDLVSNPLFKYSGISLFFFFLIVLVISTHSPLLIDRFLLTVSPPIFIMAALSFQSVSENDFFGFFKFFKRYALIFSCFLMLALHVMNENADWEGTAKIVQTFPECNNEEILAAPSFGFWLQSYYFTSESPKFVDFNKANYERVLNNNCPILSWSTELKLFDNSLEKFLSAEKIELGSQKCIVTNKAQICFK